MLSFFLAMLKTEEDRQRFTKLYEQCNEQIEKKAKTLLKNQQDAEDAVQNTYIQIIRHFEKVYEIPCDELTFWCISIVKNEAYMILRKKQKTMIKQRFYRATLCLAILVAIFFIGVVIYEQQYSISSDFSELEEEIIRLVCADEEVKIDKFRTLCNKTYGHYVIVYWMTSRDVDGFAVLKVGINGKYRLQKLNYQYYDLGENHKGVLDCSRISLGNRTVSVIYGRFFADPTNISVVNVYGQTLVDLDAPFFLEITPEDVFRDSELVFYCKELDVFIGHDELGHIKWTKNKS